MTKQDSHFCLGKFHLSRTTYPQYDQLIQRQLIENSQEVKYDELHINLKIFFHLNKAPTQNYADVQIANNVQINSKLTAFIGLG